MYSYFIHPIFGTQHPYLGQILSPLNNLYEFEYSLGHEPIWIPRRLVEREAKSRPQLRTTREKGRYHVCGIY